MTRINPDDHLETDAGRVWTPERNAEAWRRSFQQLERAIADAGPSARVILVCGLQGAGKTCWIGNQPSSAGTIYFDAALPRARHRAPVIDIARRSGVDIEAVWIDTPLAMALIRNARRPEDQVVPNAAIRSVADRFEPPRTAEGFARVRIVRPED